MAVPRVFISSTCYDLGEIRDTLVSFIESYGYLCILSEKGDVFYHPDYHTHDSCLHEIENCDLFILIIGGRFGGKYIADPNKSIVNAEYIAAKKCDIPVFTFVKKDVYSNHHFYQKNKNKKEIEKMEFPAIEKQEHAIYIFEFINEIKSSKVNNGIFEFGFGQNIKNILKKQLAGMFYNFLSERKREKEHEYSKRLLDDISLASEKTGELLKHIYRIIDKSTADEVLEVVNNEMEAKKFFQEISRDFQNGLFKKKELDKISSLNSDINWEKFLINNAGFFIERDTITGIALVNTSMSKVKILSNEDKKWLDKLFSSFKKLDKKKRKEILSQFIK